MSHDGCVALPRGAMGLYLVIVVFSDHTHLLFLTNLEPDLDPNCGKNRISMQNINSVFLEAF